MRHIPAFLLVGLGAAWPFVAHWLAMTRLYGWLTQDPRKWVFYSIFVVVLPCPAIVYSGWLMFLREQIPFPAYAVVSAIATACTLAAVAILYFIGVGQIGFTVPFRP